MDSNQMEVLYAVLLGMFNGAVVYLSLYSILIYKRVGYASISRTLGQYIEDAENAKSERDIEIVMRSMALYRGMLERGGYL